jgi:hypothetical protein
MHQPFSDDSWQRPFPTSAAVQTYFDPIAIAKVKFRQIAVLVSAAAMMIDGLRAAFQDAVIALNRTRVHPLNREALARIP